MRAKDDQIDALRTGVANDLHEWLAQKQRFLHGTDGIPDVFSDELIELYLYSLLQLGNVECGGRQHRRHVASLQKQLILCIQNVNAIELCVITFRQVDRQRQGREGKLREVRRIQNFAYCCHVDVLHNKLEHLPQDTPSDTATYIRSIRGMEDRVLQDPAAPIPGLDRHHLSGYIRWRQSGRNRSVNDTGIDNMRKSTMAVNPERHFEGFSRKTFTFLRDLGRNNDKTWFNSHRSVYEEHVLEPLRNLVTDVADSMLGIDLSFEVAPAVGKTISRIYRDTRFSANKSPFRDCMWIVFKRSGKDWSRYIPGYFLEITPKSYRYGLGFYDAAPDLMARFRQRIDEDPKSFLKAIEWFTNQDVFVLEGERYKRPIGQDKPAPIRTWYGYRSFYLTCNRTIDEAILSPTFAKQLTTHFGLAAPLYRYIFRIASQVLGERR